MRFSITYAYGSRRSPRSAWLVASGQSLLSSSFPRAAGSTDHPSVAEPLAPVSLRTPEAVLGAIGSPAEGARGGAYRSPPSRPRSTIEVRGTTRRVVQPWPGGLSSASDKAR